MKQSTVVLLGLGLGLAGAGCLAQHESPYTMSPSAFANYLSIQPMMYRLKDSHRTIFGQSVEQSLRGATPPGGRAAASTVVPSAAYSTSGTTRTIERMAAKLPQAQRAQASGVFRELLVKYAALERQFGIPPRDVAGAVAAYVAGCHMAYHNSPFPDAHFKPLVAQMRRTLAADPEFARIPGPQLQQLYDEMALGGMMLAAAQIANQTRPDANAVASLRSAAGRQLQQFLGRNPDSVRITAAGLTLL